MDIVDIMGDKVGDKVRVRNKLPKLKLPKVDNERTLGLANE